MDEGSDITIVWDKTVASINAFRRSEGRAKNVRPRQTFINPLFSPDAAASISEALGVAPVNLAAKPKLE